MRRLAFAIAAFGVLAWSAPASAVIGETTIKVADGATPIPQATVTVTFKNRAGTPIQTVRRQTPRTGTRTVTIPDNTATVDIEVVTASGKTQTRSGIDVALLTDRVITIDVADAPGPGAPAEGPAGTIVGIGLGGKSDVCKNWRTSHISIFDEVDPPLEDTGACFSSALRGSFYAGYSTRVGSNWLAGAEADVGYANSKKTIRGIPGSINGALGVTAAIAANDSVTVEKTWDFSLRGRFGYFVTPRTVAYGTAGIAFQTLDATVNCTVAGACGSNGIPAFSQTNSKTLVGWTIGGGVETSLTDIIVLRGEYRYADYGSYTARFGTAAGLAVTSDIQVRTHTALVGVGVKLGGGR